MGAREAAEGGGQHGLSEVFLQAHAHQALQAAAVDGGDGLVVEFEQAVRVGQHRLAGLRELQPAAVTAQPSLRVRLSVKVSNGDNWPSGPVTS